MRRLLTWLIIFSVLCLASGFTGIQSIETDSRTGTVITYYHGYGRLYAFAAAAFFVVAFYGVYRRWPIAWKLGWIFLVLSVAGAIFEIWVELMDKPNGWIGALVGTLAAIAILAYWGIWWQRHRAYFAPEGVPTGWSPDLRPLRWFGIGLFVLASIMILLALIFR